MRPLLPVLLVAFAVAPAAQGWGEAPLTLVPVEAFQRPRGQVWTDMRPVVAVASEDELVAVRGGQLYAGPARVTLGAWQSRQPAGPVDCLARGTVCAAWAQGEDGQAALVLFGAEPAGLESPLRMWAVDRVRVSDAQARGLDDDLRARGLVLGDGNALSAMGAAGLVTSRPSDPDCGDPAVTCGVVFEVEVTDQVRLVVHVIG